MPVSQEDREAIARLLMTSMSDEQLKLVGQIVNIWNNNEFHFEALIWRAANWSESLGALVTADLLSASRETLAKNIISNNIRDGEWKDYALATVELFTEARITRNNLVHSLPRLELPIWSSRVGAKRSAKAGVGVIKITEHDVSDTALTKFVTVLTELALALQTAEVRLRDFVSPPDDDMPATLIEISRIRELVDLLRSQRRDLGKL